MVNSISITRSYYSKNLQQFLDEADTSILGEFVKKHEFALDEKQRNAWLKQIRILKDQLNTFDSGHILFEYSIPRMGKRTDVILIYSGLVFVIEFKVNETKYHESDIDQCLDYVLDLKNFQESSHQIMLIPILVSTNAPIVKNPYEIYADGIFKPIRCNSSNIAQVIEDISKKFAGQYIDPILWEHASYKPTPTIIEAAQVLYQGHAVREISRSDAGAINLVKTTVAINEIIENSKKNKNKSICFITGVPGSGKTLAGLNLANDRHKFEEEEHAVFLSGNGPLVNVLQEALARDETRRIKGLSKKDSLRKAKAFIQNIHHFRDDALKSQKAPIERIVIFDEAQRAWDNKQTSSFMETKKGISDFNMSEPEFLIDIMDRHQDWCVIVCLIGGGQEINTGEAGLVEWFTALRNHHTNWNVFLSQEISDIEYTRGLDLDNLLSGIKYQPVSDLHLKTSIRSFRSDKVSNFVKAILDCNKEEAKSLFSELSGKYPIILTREISKAKDWLKDHARGNERFGIVASSNAYRLKPFGIFVELDLDAKNWFLNSKHDLRSSYYLEYVATEFDIQGLELDWVCVAWDANLRFDRDKWTFNQFHGKDWRNIVNEQDITYLKNAYRVLLTRARQGLVIFIPRGSDTDHTRKPEFYDGTYLLLKEIGLQEI